MTINMYGFRKCLFTDDTNLSVVYQELPEQTTMTVTTESLETITTIISLVQLTHYNKFGLHYRYSKRYQLKWKFYGSCERSSGSQTQRANNVEFTTQMLEHSNIFYEQLRKLTIVM